MPRKSSRRKRRATSPSRVTWLVTLGLLLLVGILVYVQFPGIGLYLKSQIVSAFQGGAYIAAGDVTGDGVPDLITGRGPGGDPRVQVFNGANNNRIRSFLVYDSAFTGGVRVASGDVTGDGRPDIITAPGPGGSPQVKVFDGVTSAEVNRFLAYDPAMTAGVFVAAGDVNGDGRDDIITGPDTNSGPHVKVFDGANPATVLRSFMAYNPAFGGGVRVASADITGDGTDDLITGPGVTGSPHVKVFNGITGDLFREWQAYDSRFTGGIFVAAADVTGDGRADVLTGPDQGGGPHVRVFSGTDNALARNFFAFDSRFAGGIRIVSADYNRDGKADMIAAAGPGGNSHVKVFSGTNHAAVLRSFFAFTTTTSPSPSPSPITNFTCQPQFQTVALGTPVTVYEDPAGGQLNVQWSAPNGNPSTGTGTSFITTFNQPGAHIITATLPNGQQTTACRVDAVASAPNPSPIQTPSNVPTLLPSSIPSSSPAVPSSAPSPPLTGPLTDPVLQTLCPLTQQYCAQGHSQLCAAHTANCI